MGLDLFASFIAGDRSATDLLPSRPFEDAAWAGAARRASGRGLAPGLLEELRRQSAALPPSPARETQLDLLGRRDATVVVTGQQVGLFLGPLYTLHKAATVVARARRVKELTGLPCVPVFWLQTEDHDWAEISRAEVLVKSGRHVLALPPEPASAARVSLANRTLPAEVDGLVEELGHLLEPFPHAAEVVALVGRHYRSGVSPGVAFAGVLSELFAADGLVLLDPRTPAMARLAAPVLRRALLEGDDLAGLLSARARELAARGVDEQVHTREEASLVFFHPRGVGGPRFRLVRGRGEMTTPDGPVTREALLALLDEDPLRFSTSALLRPLVQDSLLPTVAYVGGPAECAYFAQLPPLYDRFGIDFPLVAPRARLRIVVPRARRELERLGLVPADVDRPREALLRELVARPPEVPPADVLCERLLGTMRRELELLAPHLTGLDPSLARNVERTGALATFAVGRLAEGVERAVARKDGVTVGRLDRLLEALRPSGKPQERVYAFPALAARAGCRVLVEAMTASAEPLSPEVRDVNL